MSVNGVFECVPNVSEGRDRETVDRLAAAAGAPLLDVHTDRDHHRSVYTLGGDLTAVATSARRLAEQAFLHVDIGDHQGVHPRRGALDVVPFVALDPSARPAAADAARQFAGWVAGTLEVPVFLYGGADPEGRTLPDLRSGAFDRFRPDRGPGRPHPSFGVVAVGERPPLAAVNCLLDTDDVEAADAIARAVRERDGGLPGVRALGFALASRGRVQVSMNVTDLTRTSVEQACTTVRTLARDRDVDVAEVELVGLVPEAEYERWSGGFVEWAGIGPDRTVEARLRG